MNEQLMAELHDIGLLVDKLDEHFLSNRTSIDKDALNYISTIEEKFRAINIEQLENDLKVVYLYTKANYKAILKIMADTNFEVIHDGSMLVKQYKDYDDFVFNNYALRIKAYRLAIRLSKLSKKLDNLFVSQIYVNLSNVYIEMGRIVESIEELKKVEHLVDHFPMARGNLAIKHISLAQRITDRTVMRFLIEKGLAELEDVCASATPDVIPVDSLQHFQECERYMENFVDTHLSDNEPWSENSDVDDVYKVWSAERNLALNYVNIIYKKGNIDDVHMINMGVSYFKKENNMEYYSWFNTIKQEYNISRYFLYRIDCMRDDMTVHESQRYNTLINTLDYPAVGYRTELLKTSLKTAFSVLDKIGLFCCKFHKQNIRVQQIDFHKWYKEIELDVALRSPFNALYWLSKDLDFKNGDMRVIRLLRNCIEHRYIRVLESYDISFSEELADNNKYEYIVSYSDLECATYETLRLVRRAIFYMANGFNVEYNRVYYGDSQNGVFIPLSLDTYDDEWKN
ncbi:LA2681 family HEPN domain-containing protein [Bacillus wiedmannii]|uniref:LA2681 family HEPN domain-containing protein n=1 Tax=Bacillus wiedmannii TaxID=1890302 RepID=UPI0021D36B10|nr:LA2681 family HEPN domain-containing protein [Bacillus wiedmannii]MCU5578290.1 LA2681 family HEPN domain-containing protein [Bacillus wiedmannii]